MSALEAEHPVLEVRRAGSSLGTGALDLVSVTKTARSITSEIELDRLLAAVLRIILENAGAQSGFLLLEREGQWSVAARDEIGAPEVEVARGRVSAERDLLSQNVVRYVARTREWVVLDDAARHGAFIEDPHLVRERTRSLLCAPLLSRGRLVGILYLQNNLAAGAFTRDRVDLLEILLSQAATSLENARSYEALLRANRELQESEAKLREAQRIAHVGYWERDLAENRVELSDEACRILGLQLQGSVVNIEQWHERWLHLVHPEDRSRVAEAFAAALTGGSPYRAEYRVVRPTGEVRFVRSEARLSRDGSGHPQRMVGMLEDITERHDAAVLRESEERFRTMANAIPQLAWMARPDGHVYWYNQRWCEYTGIRPEQMQGWGWQVLHHPEVLPRVLEAWEKCLESCEAFEMEFPLRRADGAFRRFLTRVLPFRDADGRVVQWFGTHTDVTELVEAQAVLKKERDFSSAVIDTVGALVVILDRQGCIRRFNRARVRDNGAGISPESLPRLFVPFVQAPQTIERSQGGLGLGLALVKGLVEMHGGSVAVRSEGKGSEFTVVLPLHSPEQEKPAAARTPKSRSRMRRVLVVEDNADAAESLREALELGEHEVTVAHSGPEGVEAARRYQPDVVLCDIGLPEMDGYGVAKALRADTSASLRSTFLVALSGYARQEDVRRSMEAGFDRHMAKPPSIEAVEKLLAEATAGTAASEPGFSRS